LGGEHALPLAQVAEVAVALHPEPELRGAIPKIFKNQNFLDESLRLVTFHIVKSLIKNN
jgi:hypothetical protein